MTDVTQIARKKSRDFQINIFISSWKHAMGIHWTCPGKVVLIITHNIIMFFVVLWRNMKNMNSKFSLKIITKQNLECTVDGSPLQIPLLCANVANCMMDRWTDGRTLLLTLTMKGNHEPSLVKFRQVVRGGDSLMDRWMDARRMDAGRKNNVALAHLPWGEVDWLNSA